MEQAPRHLYVAPVARCGCGRSYSKREWLALVFRGLQDAPAGDDPVAEPGFTLELRDCACGSTISVEVGADLATLKARTDEASRDCTQALQMLERTKELLFAALSGPVPR